MNRCSFRWQMAPLLCAVITSSYSYRPSVPNTASSSRRAFVANSAVTIAWTAFAHQSQAIDINVTPIAHTFTTSGGSAKPLRENDTTRYLTNARVVYLLEGSDANADLASTVLELTAKRKSYQGPGVTPGQLHVAGNKALVEKASFLGIQTESLKDTSAQAVAKLAASLPVGDTLIVGPVSSSGMAADGKLGGDTAQALGVPLGGAKSGGVISVLLDGPKKNAVVDEGAYTLLWYSIP